MQIVSLRYSDLAASSLIVTLAGGGTIHLPWPCGGWQGEAVADWLAADESRAIEAYSPPAAPSIVTTAAETRAIGIAALDELFRSATAGYPAAEVAGWPTKDREARAILAGADPADTTVVGPLAAMLGQPVEAVAAAIVAKADAYTTVSLWIEVRLAAFDAALAAAETADARAAALASLIADIETAPTGGG